MSALRGKRTLNDVTWSQGKTAHKATVVAWLGAPGEMMILRDAFEVYFIARVGSRGHGEVEIIGGPVSVEDALTAAEVALGGHDHGSVTALIGTLALGLVASRIKELEGESHAAER